MLIKLIGGSIAQTMCILLPASWIGPFLIRHDKTGQHGSGTHILWSMQFPYSYNLLPQGIIIHP